VKDELVKLRASANQKRRWEAAAAAAGVPLSVFVRQRLDGLEPADSERELEEQKAPEPVIPAAERSRTPGPRVRPGRSIGAALREADRNAGSRGPLL
jgi:hypothetical protein